MIRPQPGPQEAFLASPADIVIFGGAAGGGKSWALLMESLRHINNAGFGAVIFRRTYKQIADEGGLWDKSGELFPFAGGITFGKNQWQFPSGAKVTFSHMQHEKNKYDWDGAQIPLICWDELIHFTATMFWYLLSRNRSTCGVRPYVRATCNPDSESWVAELISWWIDQDTGYPIQARSGVLRWFIRNDEHMIWGNSKQELLNKFPDQRPQSLTFIPSTLADNKILEAKDPEYRAKLMSMPLVERERLLAGNWKIRPRAGLKFPRDKWRLIDALPAGVESWCRFWDKAYTEGGTGARTAGVLMGRLNDAAAKALGFRFVVANAVADRWGDAERESNTKATAALDQKEYGRVSIGIEQEPGAGKQAAFTTASNLAGYEVFIEKPTTSKHIRWTPLASQQQIGNVAVVKGDWDWNDFIRELDALAGHPDLDKAKLRDLADAASGAFKFLESGDTAFKGDLICSGDEEDDRTPLSAKELEDAELPDYLRDVLVAYRDDGRNTRDY
jgi:phage terminase large subunit-like protein